MVMSFLSPEVREGLMQGNAESDCQYTAEVALERTGLVEKESCYPCYGRRKNISCMPCFLSLDDYFPAREGKKHAEEHPKRVWERSSAFFVLFVSWVSLKKE